MSRFKANFAFALTYLLAPMAICCLLVSLAPAQNGQALLTYDELVRLFDEDTPPANLQLKLDDLLSFAFVNNDASAQDVKPLKPQTAAVGNFLRVVFWNIEQGLEFEAIEAAFKSPAKFAALLDAKRYPPRSAQRAAILREVEAMKQADVIVLNEVDWGIKRTDYRHVTEDLAKALNMNWAFGVEFIEIDPIALGTEQFEGLDEEDRAELIAQVRVEPTQYKGMHGNAILSRYPLENVRVIRFKNQGHDWYADEKKGVTDLEKGRRKLGKEVFSEKISRQVRRGGRMMLVAEISDAEFPGSRITIVSTHLEDRTKPSNRLKQLEEILAHIKPIQHPVVLAGDMNTSTRDMTPTSIGRQVRRRLGSKSFWATRGIKYATGVGFLWDVAVGGIRIARVQADPTVRSIWLVSRNREAAFFDALTDFRFDDGGAFDFRGDRDRSTGRHQQTLANSNERASKGFATTYQMSRTIGPIGRFKLDWIFVKPAALTAPYDRTQSYRLAPHFGRTLKDLNYAVEDRVSDHNPVLVDLPLAEPTLKAKAARFKQ